MTDRSCDTAAWKGLRGKRAAAANDGKTSQSAAGAAPPIGEQRREAGVSRPRHSDAQLHIVRDNKSRVLLKCDQHFLRSEKTTAFSPKSSRGQTGSLRATTPLSHVPAEAAVGAKLALLDAQLQRGNRSSSCYNLRGPF